jgi:hypothetical protein
MRHVVVNYRVAPERVAENEELVRAVYQELAASRPTGLRYATFKLADGVSFMHVAETAEEHNPLPELESFKRFQVGLGERCDEAPVVTALSPIGSYGID